MREQYRTALYAGKNGATTTKKIGMTTKNINQSKELSSVSQQINQSQKAKPTATKNFSIKMSTQSLQSKSRIMTEDGASIQGQSNESPPQKYIQEQIENLKHLIEKEQEMIVLNTREQALYNSQWVQTMSWCIQRDIDYMMFKQELLKIRDYWVQNQENQNNVLRQQNSIDNNQVQETQLIEKLFSFDFLDQKKLSCNTIDYNKENDYIFAAGYGSNSSQQDHGEIIIWNFKTPDNPELKISTESSVYSCAFGIKNPNMLAVGCLNGKLLIYDISLEYSQTLLFQSFLKDSVTHIDCIWRLYWQNQSHNENQYETLISISSDSKVIEWSIRKSLEGKEVKFLNLILNEDRKSQLNENINFKQVQGFDMDFNQKDPNIYYVAADDSNIYKCSLTYKERYLETYTGHNASVYKIKCNPFDSDIFMSCSADWSVLIWHQSTNKPIAQYKSIENNDEIIDIQWSPQNSTSFVLISKDGWVEVWDISLNKYDPVMQLKLQEPKQDSQYTNLKFHKKLPVVLLGKADGSVDLFMCHYKRQIYQNKQKEKEKLYKALKLSSKEK